MEDCNPISTSIDSGVKLSKNDEDKAIYATLYESLVGNLKYLTCTRPNILYSISHRISKPIYGGV